VRILAVSLIVLSAAGCMTYRGPLGVEQTIERKSQVTLHRESGFKLGPISTKIATSIVHHYAEDQDYRDLSGIGVAVFKVTGHTGPSAQPITAKDLGFEGWAPMIENRSGGDQLLVLAKAARGEIRELMFLSIESDEVVVARLKGHLDGFIAKTFAAVDRNGAHGARTVVGAGEN
jgi:hypothetical protein